MNAQTAPAMPHGAIARLQRVMALAGWEVEYVDMDLTGQRPTAEIKVIRGDGRWLWARVDSHGRCTTETFQRERCLGMAKNQRGRRPLVPLVDDVFLGRCTHEGPRAMLRGMTNYLADNALHPVALADLRSAWAGVMAAPTRMLGHNAECDMVEFAGGLRRPYANFPETLMAEHISKLPDIAQESVADSERPRG